MTDGCCHAAVAVVIECDGTEVVERELDFAGALLFGYFARHGAVDLVCQPVLTADAFEFKDVADIVEDACDVVGYFGVGAGGGDIVHDSLRWIAEHVGELPVDGFNAVVVAESEVHVACCFSHDVHRCSFAVGYFA